MNSETFGNLGVGWGQIVPVGHSYAMPSGQLRDASEPQWQPPLGSACDNKGPNRSAGSAVGPQSSLGANLFQNAA